MTRELSWLPNSSVTDIFIPVNDGLLPGSLVSLLRRERPRPDRIRNSSQAWILAVAAVCVGAFMGQLDASVVTLVYRPVEAQFHAPLAAVEWVSLAYLLPLIALLVPVGRLSDAYGRKLFYLYGFVIFTAASAACGLAPTLVWLVVFRVMQAVGAALLQANSVALVTNAPPPEHRRHALGAQAAAQALGLALGPTVGGLVVSTLGWRWVFFINVPVGVIALIAGYYLLPRTRERTSATGLDWPSVGILAVATTSLLLAISAGSGLPVPAAISIGLLVVAGIATCRFLRRQQQVGRPLIDVVLLKDRTISLSLLAALCGYLVLFGPLVLVPIVLTARGMSALAAGLTVTALPAGFALAAVGIGLASPSSPIEARRAAFGAGISAAALCASLVVPRNTISLVALLLVIGLGLGIFVPSNNTLIMGAIPMRASATGGGLINLARGLGTALGVALVTLALHVGPHLDAGISGESLALLFLLVAAAAAAFAVRVAIKTPRRADR